MEPIVDALKYITPYGFDVLTYTILTRLSLDRPKVRAALLRRLAGLVFVGLL